MIIFIGDRRQPNGVELKMQRGCCVELRVSD
jgi:hypothetical protein